METITNKLENSQVELKVTFSADEWKAAQDKALKKLAQNVKIDGFRQGKAPLKMVKARIHKAAILEEAVDMIAKENYVTIIESSNVEPVAQPELAIDELSEEVLKITIKATVKPEVELKEYKGLEVKKEEVEVTEEEITNRLTDYQNQFAELVIKEEGTVENGDTTVIDFEGFKDGVAFEGGKGENHTLEIGSHSFIPGFEEAMIGMAKGETKDLNLTFPEEYPAEDLAGAEVVFKVTVHEIKTKELPEIDDELAKDVNVEGVETLEELKNHIKEQLLTSKQTQADRDFEENLATALVEVNPVEVPQVMIDNELDRMLNDIASNLQQQGISMELYLQFTGKTAQEMREELTVEAEKRVKYNLILDAIVEKEEIVISDEEVDEEIGKIAEMYGKEASEIKDMFAQQIPYIKADLASRKAAQLIKDSVK